MGDEIVVSPEIFASVVVNTMSVKTVLTGIHFQAICKEMTEKEDAGIMVERMDLTIIHCKLEAVRNLRNRVY